MASGNFAGETITNVEKRSQREDIFNVSLEVLQHGFLGMIGIDFNVCLIYNT
jgi:hypothetical protein